MDDYQIKMITWNIENFVKINKIIKDTNAIYNLKQADLIFFQEWKQIEGLILINKLNNGTHKFKCITKDRCSIAYNVNKFELNKITEIKITNNEILTFIERRYTSTKPHSSLCLSLIPKNPKIKMNIDILHCVCFHLAALNPSSHPTIHKNQMKEIMNITLKQFKENKQNGLIIAGDTNYRTSDNDLVDKLINTKIIKKYNLHDVCEKSNCIDKPTQ